MPERLRKQVLGRLPRGWLLGCGVVALAALPALGAESLPASVRACSTIADSTERLSCYDREVASFPAPEAKAGSKAAPAAASSGAGGQAAAGGNGVGNGVAAASSGKGSGASTGAAAASTGEKEAGNGLASSGHASSSNAATSSGTNTAAPAGSSDSGTGSQASAAGNGVGNGAAAAGASDNGHISAHLVRIERIPNEMVFHLDNGQVWQELQSVPGDLSLREGDAVKIDRHFGSYWLSGPHVSSMKVQMRR